MLRTNDQRLNTVGIAEIQSIGEPRGIMFRTKEDIHDYVEGPLVDPVEVLWDMNIQTLDSSANSDDVGRGAGLVVNYESLSDPNQQIARELGDVFESGDGHVVLVLSEDINTASTVDDISNAFLAKVRQFRKQKMTWAPTYTLDELNVSYGASDDPYDASAFEEEGYYYDAEAGVFYLSEEHYQKATEDIVDL